MSKAIKVTIAIFLVVLLALTFAIGYQFGGVRHQSQNGIAAVDEAWNVVFTDYVDGDRLDAGALSGAAIRGIVKELNDPYTSYLAANDYKMSVSQLQGQFDGIGATVAIKDRPTIVAPLRDSPTARAGIKSLDIILEINGKSTAGMSLSESVLNIRGPSGTSVKLLVLHLGESNPVEIEIVRSKIEVASVNYEMKGDIGYIDITQFSERSDRELIPALQSVIDQGATGLVIDLRGNPGGLLDVVVNIASHFISDGNVAKVRSNKQEITTLPVRPSDLTTRLPIVVLTDNSSASGSEVLAGALQDHGRAVIAGTRTFGKGSVNVLRQLGDGSGIYITTARWLTPNGRLIEGKGIEPDITLELKGDEEVQWAIDYLHGKR